MKASLSVILILLFHIFFSGCAGIPMAVHEDTALLVFSQEEAIRSEKNGDLQKALLYWKIIRELNPDSKQVVLKIAGLKETIKTRSDMHFKRGVAAFEKGAFDAAQKEFLITLQYDPNHKRAVKFLKTTFARGRVIHYEVEKDDTFREIAGRIYKDPNKDFLVSYFAGKEITEMPDPGVVIELPVLDDLPIRRLEINKHRPKDVEKQLAKAKAFFMNKEYDKISAIVEQVLFYDPKNKEATELKNALYYKMGKEALSKGKYLDALKMFEQADPEYGGISKSISAVKTKMRDEAEMHYRQGVRYFVDEDLERAIAEWEKTLAIHPEHGKAKADIEKAKGLMQRLKQIK